MVRFIIVRHGYSEANKANRFCGQTDVALDEKGLRQANEVSKYIKNTFDVGAIYSSDLCRAYDTVKPLSEATGIPIVKKKALREIDVGVWQGLSVDEAAEKFPATFSKYKHNPWTSRFEGGEGYADVTVRAMAALEDIAKEHEGHTVVIATHGGVVRTIIAALSNTPTEKSNEIPHVANASITVAEYENGHAAIPCVGYCDYLSEKTTNLWVK